MRQTRRDDPYLWWRALRTGHSATQPTVDGPSAPLPQAPELAPGLYAVLVERKQADQPLIFEHAVDVSTQALLGLNRFDFAPAHTHAIQSDSGLRPRFQPGLVTRHGLHLLSEATRPPWSDHKCNNIRRWEFSHVGRAVPFDLAVPAAAGRGSSSRASQAAAEQFLPWWKLALELRDQARHPPLRKPSPRAAAATPVCREVFVCVIDDGCNFASASLQRGRRRVISEVLVQGRDPEALAAGARSGLHRPALHRVSDERGSRLRGALQGWRLRVDPEFMRHPGSATGPDPSDEISAYRDAGLLHPVPHAWHGAGVLDLIANPRLWIGDQSWPRRAPDQLLFVQLSPPTVIDTSGSSLASSVLVAIHDALDQAGPGQDVLVNLSFGTHGGPHDGSSMIECALLELLDLFDGSPKADGKRLILVVPAGNSHLLRCHARGMAMRRATSEFDWKVLPDDDTDNLLEVWVPRHRPLTLELVVPSGEVLVVKCDPDAAMAPISFDSAGKIVQIHPVGMVAYSGHPPQAERSAMILIALEGNVAVTRGIRPAPAAKPSSAAPSQPLQTGRSDGRALGSDISDSPDGDITPGRSFAAHGIWRIRIRPDDDECMPWHAWVQRGDVAPQRRRSARGVIGRQSYILDSCESRPDPMFTLNGIATARHARLFVVGALEREDGRLSPYSSSGPASILGSELCDGCRIPSPDRTCGPDWVVAADESRRRPGLLVQGVLSGARQRVSGTSMAAATFTRHLWEHLSAGKDLDAFCGPSPNEDPAPHKVPAEAPEYAPDFCRGDAQRLSPTRPDGAL